MISRIGKRRIAGLIIGIVVGLSWAIWDNASAFDAVAFTILCAYSGIVLAEKSRDRLTARNIILAALAGSGVFATFKWLMGKTDSIILLRDAVNGALIGAIIGSEPQKATRGGKVGGGIGAGLGVVVGIIFVVREGITMAARTGIPPFEVTGPIYVVGFTMLAGTFTGAVLGAFINAIPR